MFRASRIGSILLCLTLQTLHAAEPKLSEELEPFRWMVGTWKPLKGMDKMGPDQFAIVGEELSVSPSDDGNSLVFKFEYFDYEHNFAHIKCTELVRSDDAEKELVFEVNLQVIPWSQFGSKSHWRVKAKEVSEKWRRTSEGEIQMVRPVFYSYPLRPSKSRRTFKSERKGEFAKVTVEDSSE